ncbi:MAG: class I SAM-dependent methyltransferase [Eubacteriales bacterium]|nr:class I SAM-dependent methyltransferase [Eubacteriales bacterium]
MKKTVNGQPSLSKRMQALVQMVDERRVADIGCDHAFVSVNLLLSNKAETVIAMDVRKGPLAIAEKNIRSYGLQNKISVRLSDGFSALAVGEVDCAIIAGMGGLLMVRILQQAKEHLSAGIHLVLQPQSEADQLRSFLVEQGYMIVAEQMLIDEDKFYTVIKAVPAKGQSVRYTKAELCFGPCLLRNRNEVLHTYLIRQDAKLRELRERLLHIDTDKAKERLNQIEAEWCLIRESLHIFVEEAGR